jgi:hypothetical protein
MKPPIDCNAVLSLRDEYLHGRGPVAVVERHLADCAICLDAFLDAALTAQPSVVAFDTFPIAAAALDFVPEISMRRAAILGVSGLVGVVVAYITCLVFHAADDTTPFLTSSHALILAGAMTVGFVALLFGPEIVRAD